MHTIKKQNSENHLNKSSDGNSINKSDEQTSKFSKPTKIGFKSIVAICTMSVMSCATITHTNNNTSDNTNNTNNDTNTGKGMTKKQTPQTTVASVNLDNYQGIWYEIARLPMYFQRNCASDVTATYTKRQDGNITVTNQCTDKKGKPMISNGVASVDKKYPNSNNSRLLVNFLPESLQWLPIGSGGYWILALDTNEKEDYTHALIGSPSRKYLWVLSRTPNMSEVDYQRYLEIAKAQGYDLTGLMKTTHTQ